MVFKIMRPANVESQWIRKVIHLASGEFYLSEEEGDFISRTEADLELLLRARVGSWMIPLNSITGEVKIVRTKREAIAAIKAVEEKIVRVGGEPFVQVLRLDSKKGDRCRLTEYSFLGDDLLYNNFYDV